MSADRLRPLLASLVGLLLIGASLASLLLRETPMGTVTGTVLLLENGKPLREASVYLNRTGPGEDSQGADGDAGEIPSRTRDATTDAHGRFTLTRVPAGNYSVNAHSEYHTGGAMHVSVREARTSAITVRLKRSETELSIAAHQTVWQIAERPRLPVKGYIDPKKGEFDSLRVRVYKSRLSTLMTNPKSADALDRLAGANNDDGPLPAALLRPTGVADSDAPRLVSSTDVPVMAPDREGFFDQRLVIPSNGPGVYLVQVDHAGKSDCSWVLSTNTALVVKRAQGQVVAYAVDMRSGIPVSGATIRQFRNGGVIKTGTTDANGLSEMAVPEPPKPKADSADADTSGESARNRMVTVAFHGDDEAVLNRTEWNQSDAGDAYAVYAYPDRTVYRPGQSVSYKAIVRRKEASTSARPYTVPANAPVKVEVRDPQGDLVTSDTKTTNRFGSLSGRFDLSAEAPTGTYSLICTVEGEKHATDIAVASYRKPEFSVTVTPKKSHYVRGETVELTIRARYYYGAPVVGATVAYHAYRDTDWTTIHGPDFDPEDASDNETTRGAYYGELVKDGTALLDARGEATVILATDKKSVNAARRARNAAANGGDSADPDDSADAVAPDAPEEQLITCSTTVTDDAKRQVDAEGTAHVSSGDYVLSVTPEGFLGEPGKPISVVVSARDHDGQPAANVPLVLTPTYRRWNAKTGVSETIPVGPPQHATTSAAGSAVLPVVAAKAGEVALLLTGYDSAGRVLHARSSVYVSRSGGGDLQTEYSDLSLLTDKKQYGPGDTARVLINTARIGQSVLLTVEGDRVYRSVVLPIRSHSTVVEVPVQAGWGPNVTLEACYVRNKKFAQSSAPLRVRMDRQALTVSVTADRAVYKPGETATYRIKTTDASGRPTPCEVSLAVVDESIFAIRADDPRALKDAFYPRRSNRVTTQYSFSVEYLGDTDKSEPAIEMRRKFLDTAAWQPHIETGPDGTATIPVVLPDNLTTWRATVQAVTLDTSVGRARGAVVVTKPFLIRLDTPRFLTQSDSGRLLTLAHNGTGSAQTVHVRMVAPGLVTSETPGTQTVRVAAGADGQIEWPISAQVVGMAAIRVEAWTDGTDPATARRYTDGVETSLPVRAWGRETLTAFAGVMTDNSVAERSFSLAPEAALAESRLLLRITPSVGAALAPALDYLAGYPYGCTEQTMSRILPDLLVAGVEKKTGRTLLTGDNAAKRTLALPKMVKNGILRLRRFQHSSGAWGWWEQDGDDPFLTAYVLDGLSHAKTQGFDVPDALLAQGKKGALDQLGKASPNDRPFLMYALALSGETAEPVRRLRAVETGKTKDAGMDLSKLAPDALAYLVLLARQTGEDYRPAWKRLQRAELPEGRLLHWKNDPYRWRSSDRMATSLALRAFLAVNPRDPRIVDILRYLMAARADDAWGNTRDTAAVLGALTDYLTVHPEDAAQPSGVITVAVNGRTQRLVDFGGAERGERGDIVVRVPRTALVRGSNTLGLTRTGGTGTLFFTGGLRTVLGTHDGSLPALNADGLQVERTYVRVAPVTLAGGTVKLGTEDVPSGVFKQDEQVRVRLKITAPRDIDYVLIEDEFPSNLEVTERGTAEEATVYTEGADWSYWYNNVDVRDDRIAFFATHLTKGVHIVEYNLRAQTPGICHALPAMVQAMYAPEIRAETGDSRIEVSR